MKFGQTIWLPYSYKHNKYKTLTTHISTNSCPYGIKFSEYVTDMLILYLKLFYLGLQKYSKSDFVPLALNLG